MGKKRSILTDFNAEQFDAVERAAASTGLALATWVAEAVSRAVGERNGAEPGEAREVQLDRRVDEADPLVRNQVRIRVPGDVYEKLDDAAKDVGVGLSTIVRELSLAAADAADRGAAGKLWSLASSAKRRTRALR